MRALALAATRVTDFAVSAPCQAMTQEQTFELPSQLWNNRHLRRLGNRADQHLKNLALAQETCVQRALRRYVASAEQFQSVRLHPLEASKSMLSLTLSDETKGYSVALQGAGFRRQTVMFAAVGLALILFLFLPMPLTVVESGACMDGHRTICEQVRRLEWVPLHTLVVH